MTIYVNKEIKEEILNLSSSYIKKAKNLYKKEGNKNKRNQKISLLSVYNNLLRGKYKKVLKALDKDYKEDKIENIELYNFLYYTAYTKLNDRENAKKWYLKLSKHKNAKKLILKSRKVK